MKTAILLLMFYMFAFGGDIKPKKSYALDSPAVDMVLRGSVLYACTDKGDIYEVGKTAKKLYSLPRTATQKRVHKATSLDILAATKTVAMAAEDGYLYISKNGTMQKSGFHTDSVIKKVLLVSENLVVIGLVSSQIILFDMSNNKTIYSTQVSSSPFSDMALSADKKNLAVAGEAGAVYMLDITSGKIKAVYKNVNLDNIYKIDFQNHMILTAGQDRKATLITEAGGIKAKFEADFLIYAAALSPSSARVAIAINEQNDIAVFDTLTKSRIANAKGHNATLNRIVFINETEFASCADENKILIWGIK